MSTIDETEIVQYAPNKGGIWIFMIGALLSFVLFFSNFLQDTEAIIFSALLTGDTVLTSMRCPEIITTAETGTIEAQVSNQADKSKLRVVRTRISKGHLTYARESQDNFYLDPGEHRDMTWTIYPEDAAYGYLVLTKVYVFPQDPMTSYVGTCGTMVLDLPFLRGWQIIAAINGLSLVMMAVGYTKYVRLNRPMFRRKRAVANLMLVIAAVIITGMVVCVWENFYLELVLAVFGVLLFAEATFYISQS